MTQKPEEVGMNFLHINQQVEDKHSQENLLPKSGQILFSAVIVIVPTPFNLQLRNFGITFLT